MPQISTARRAFLLLVVCSFFLCWQFVIPSAGNPSFVVPDHAVPGLLPGKNYPRAEAESEPFYHEQFANPGKHNKAHAASASSATQGIVVYWYGGSDEGASDVRILRATFNNAWSDPTPVMGIDQASNDLQRYVRKVGNAVLVNPGDGVQWLFFVTVSAGGWAGSSISYVTSTDNGISWSQVKRLVTSPFLNLSTLVRTRAIFYDDGSIGLPVYHEFIGKFGELLRLDQHGRVLGKSRLHYGTESLQPAIAVNTPNHAIALMRYSGAPRRNVLQTETSDAGATWSKAEKNSLRNPNGAVEVLRLNDGRLLLALNNSVMGRHDMSLAMSTNQGQSWEIIKTIEQVDISPASHDIEFSYPTLTRDDNGMFHLLYSWNDKFIKHVRFNEAWLMQP